MSQPTELSAVQVALIRSSFESLSEYSDSVIKLFYGRLFELEPAARGLFTTSVPLQSKKLYDTLSLLIGALDNFEGLRPELSKMGRAHAGYGVVPQHYEVLRTAMLWAFGQALGPEFDRPTREAWTLLLTVVSNVMIAG